MKLQIDARESGERRERAYSFYKDLNVQSEVKQLPIGDFLFDKKVVFEYKTANDFISSVKNNRIFKQCKRMQQYPFPFVIVVGNVFDRIKELYKYNPYSKKPFTEKNYLGALATILDIGCNVVQVNTQHQAFDAMYRIAKVHIENNRDKKAIDKPVCKMTDPIATFLSCVDGVGTTTAVLIKNQLKLNSLEDLCNVTFEDLTSVKGIGAKTARKILGVI